MANCDERKRNGSDVMKDGYELTVTAQSEYYSGNGDQNRQSEKKRGHALSNRRYLRVVPEPQFVLNAVKNQSQRNNQPGNYMRSPQACIIVDMQVMHLAV